MKIKTGNLTMHAPQELKPIAPYVVAASMKERLRESVKDAGIGDVIGFVQPEPPQPRQSFSESRWYVVQTEPQMESKVVEGLDAIGLAGYCPKEPKQIRRSAGSHGHSERFRIVQRPMLTGYVLVGFDITKDTWRLIPTMVRGVIRLFMVNFQPLPVPNFIIDRIREKEAEKALGPSRKLPPLPHKVGDIVQLTEHASLAGLLGAITKIDNDKRRLEVEIDLFGRLTPVELEFAHVSPVC
jgi:transcriptional antiterminator NusG